MILPVEEKIGEIRAAFSAGCDVVLIAPPGSGKTTAVPPALIDEPFLRGRKIVMLEPRRLAARSCAQYMASSRGERVGESIGYQVRLERNVSSATRLEIVTEGLLAQRLLSDPELKDTGLVVFDEFHERSLACDLSFAMALETARALRDDLRILVMSATIDVESVASMLGSGTRVVRAEGRMFPVETKYLGDVPASAAVSRALKETDGDILVFLPGEGEIRRTMETLVGTVPGNVEVLPLYGSLHKEAQDRIFSDSGRRKVILSTSIAETSITIGSVGCVIDSGLMRTARFSPARGMSGLVTLPLSLDRAEQRRGRAGRVRSGVCYRLWNEAENWTRPKKANPQILDADLASIVLASYVWGAPKRDALPWPTLPPAASWSQAENLLKSLGAIGLDGRLTDKGRRMSNLPMHPRLANMMLVSGGETAALLAAIIEEGTKSRETDIRKVLDGIKESPRDPRARRIVELSRRFARSSLPAGEFSEGALLSLAFPDRVAASRGNGAFRMVSGKGAFLDKSDPLAKEPFIVCCTLDDRLGDAKIFLASPVSREEIESLFGSMVEKRSECSWDRTVDRVKCVERLCLGEMVLSEKTQPPPPDLAIAAMLDGIRTKGVDNLPCWTPSSLALLARIRFAAKTLHDAEPPWPEAGDADILSALEGFIGGATKWKDLSGIDMTKVIDAILAASGRSRRELDRLAPPEFIVPTGSRIKIDYSGDEPVASVKLQECFGLMSTPAIMEGRAKLTIALLSPASRPVQITKDIASFWKESYPLVRKDMRGRYPKHYWPEDPFTAKATRRTTMRPACG